MQSENMNTKEVAEYLDIHEKQVYALIKAKKIPCTRVTGKWIFVKRLIDEWIANDSKKNARLEKSVSEKGSGYILAAGSNDPILEILINHTKQNSSDFLIFSSNTGSTEGLRMLGSGLTDIAWCHLAHHGTGNYDIESIKTITNDKDIAMVHLFYREIGFLASPSLNFKKNISFHTIAENNIKFINRQAGSGTRIYIDRLLAESGIQAENINGYNNEVFTHIEVGLKIISGEAEAGIATVAVAKIFGLPFIPLMKESFDMVICKDIFFRKDMQEFIENLSSSEFKKSIAWLGEYDFTGSGRILKNSV
jgi:putative molybdopterin biosynthesis protein